MEGRRVAALAAVAAGMLIVSLLLTGTCRVQCLARGHAAWECRAAPVIPGVSQCDEGEAGIGQTIDCNPGDIVGVSYSCCCG